VRQPQPDPGASAQHLRRPARHRRVVELGARERCEPCGTCWVHASQDTHDGRSQLPISGQLEEIAASRSSESKVVLRLPVPVASPHGHTTFTPVIEPSTQRWLDDVAADPADGPPLYELSPKDTRRGLRAPGDLPLPCRRLEPRQQRYARAPRSRARKPRAGGRGLRRLHARAGGPVPVQNEQAYTALEWAVASAGEIGGDPSRVAIVGDSVGGNMAAALTLLARERGGAELAAQVLFYPVTDADLDTGTCRRYADGPWLTREAMRWFWDSYLPDEERRSEITASPLQASLEQAPRTPAGAGRARRTRRAPRRARGLRAEALPGRRSRHPGPLRRHDPRLRDAQPDHDHTCSSSRDCAGGRLPAHGSRLVGLAERADRTRAEKAE
jgi:hypothetical protein